MLFGIGRELITPSYPTRMSGYATFRGKLISGIHDDLYVKTIVIEHQNKRIALVAVDLLFHDFALTEEIRAYALAEHGIEPSAFMLGYSHTHSGPAVRGYDPGQFEERYERFVSERIKLSIDRAIYDLKPGNIEYGKTIGDWNINRRLMVDGRIELAPNPSGPVDPAIRFIVLREESGSVGAIVTNYACHPVCYRDSPVVSADYPGALCRQLESHFYGSTALFFQSCGGNARPKITAKGGAFVACEYDEVADLGSSMARAIGRCINRDGLTAVEPDFAAVSFEVRLDLDPYDRSVFEEIVTTKGKRRTQAELVLQSYEVKPDYIELPAGIIRIGENLTIGWMGSEVCYEVKRVLEPLFAPHDLFFVGYADATAYIPSDAMIREGGYEAERSTVEMCLKGPIVSGVDARVRDAFRNAQKKVASA